MGTFRELLSKSGLSLAEAQIFLKITPDRLSLLELGKARLTPRERQIFKGLAFANAVQKKVQTVSRAGPSACSLTTSRQNQKSGISARKGCCADDKKLRSSMIRAASLASKPSKRKSSSGLTTLELCAGGGGTALGLEAAGFVPVALLEKDAHACATLRKNRPYWNVIQADIGRFTSDYWRDVDLLSGGLPCPPFSIAGKQLGAADERNLFPALLDIIKVVRPRAVMIENVRGLLTSKFDGFRAGVAAELDNEGFETYWAAFNALDFEVPQTRFRAFLVALRRGETKPLEWPISASNLAPTVGRTLLDLMAERGWHGASAWAKKAARPAPTIVGGSHKHGGPDLGPTRARREWAELGVDGLGLANEAPGPHFRGMPRLTIPMVARLQSFPDDWEFAGSKTHAYRQVGNALPVKLAYHVAQALRGSLS